MNDCPRCGGKNMKGVGHLCVEPAVLVCDVPADRMGRARALSLDVQRDLALVKVALEERCDRHESAEALAALGRLAVIVTPVPMPVSERTAT